MNQGQFSKIMLILQKAYTWFKTDDKLQLDVWYQIFKNDDCETMLTAVLALVCTQSKAPSIADIRKQMTKRTDDITADEAWRQVDRAIDNGAGSQYTTQERLERIVSDMHPKAIQIAQRMGWRAMAMTDVNMTGVTRGQFMKMWEVSTKHDEYQKALPRAVSDRMKALQGRAVKRLE